MRYLFYGVGLAFALLTSVTYAQEPLTSKNGEAILPVAGDFALGFNAVPLINIIGNPTAGANKFIGNMFSSNVVFGKYMLTDNAAVRASFNVNINNFTNRNFVFDNTANSPDSLVTDRIDLNSQVYVFGAGYEMRRGKGRIQAIYGGDVVFLLSRSSREYSYGNAFGILNQAPTSTVWSSAGNVINEQSIGERLVSQTSGRTVGVGVRPFIGIEYFFAPSISIGAEFGFTMMYMAQSDGDEVREFYSPAQDAIFNRTAPSAGSRSFSTGVDNMNGVIALMFYF
jgi:hypothetical protein